MNIIASKAFRALLDDRWPRVLWWESVKTRTRIPGDPQSAEPRVYLFRKSDRATLTTDDPGVRAQYELDVQGGQAVYRASVTVDGQPAADFDVTIGIDGSDALVRLQNVREHAGYCLFSFRVFRLASAFSRDSDSMMVTCYGQGRLLDPRKCKPNLIDYSWSGPARMCGAAYRSRFMVTVEVPGYEDILVQEVRQYGRVPDDAMVASLGAEVMYRQRTVEGLQIEYKKFPPGKKLPPVIPPAEPVLCGLSKDVRLHFIEAPAARKLDWTDAAKYFQSLLPPKMRCNPLYDDTFVYKIVLGNGLDGTAFYNFDRAAELVRRISHLTDGMKQVCYYTCITLNYGDSNWPDIGEPRPELGTRAGLLRSMKELRQKYNTIVSFHGNIDVFSDDSPLFDADYVARYSNGQLFSQGYWPPRQLYVISFPAYKKQLVKIVRDIVRRYKLRDTLHLDTFSGPTYVYDAHPMRPYNATQFLEAKLEVAKAINKMGIDITSECPTHPYLPYIGHIWALFNWGTTWEGEVPVPFANYIYHGATSWNAARSPWEYKTPLGEKAILECLIQGGGSGVEFPGCLEEGWRDIGTTLYLVQPPYNMLRARRWTGFRRDGDIRRVDYGEGSYIEVNDGKPGYSVVVDGVLMAKDFTTVFPGPKKGTYLAFSRTDQELDWPAPAGLKNGPVQVATLTDSGPGATSEGVVKNKRLKIKLQAFVPVRIWQ